MTFEFFYKGILKYCSFGPYTHFTFYNDLSELHLKEKAYRNLQKICRVLSEIYHPIRQRIFLPKHYPKSKEFCTLCNL